MKYDYVNVRYTPVEHCADIITLIETDKRNYTNGDAGWYANRHNADGYLKAAAKRKLAALRRKADLLTGESNAA